MKQEDIDRLKERLGDNYKVTDGYNCAVIELKDPWDGVEFVECVKYNGHGMYFKDKIYRVQYISNSRLSIYGENGELIDGIEDYKTCLYGNRFSPSTESAYIDQLKKEAFKRYGEIQVGDRFDLTFVNSRLLSNIRVESVVFDYDKKSDTLYLDDYIIYRSGKWAKKLPERVEVEFQGSSIADYGFNSYSYAFEIKNISTLPHEKIGEHLAKCLEDYLNKEAGN